MAAPMSLLHEPGDLAQTPLAAVLLEALNQRATGVLEVAHGGGTSRLWFRDGRPVGAQVFVGFRPLGIVLVQSGKIDVDTLSRSLARVAETKRPQGEILVEMGAVTREEVDRALAEQQAAYFGIIADLQQAAFVFDGSTPVPDWTFGSRLSPVRTIVEAIDRPQASALVASALRPAAAGGVRLASGYADVAESFRWTESERALVARLETPVALEAFFDSPAVSPERAQAILAALLLLGLAVPAADAPRPTGKTVVGPRIDPEEPERAPAGRRSDPAEARARRQRLLQQAMRNMGVGPFAAGDRPAPAEGSSPQGPAPGRAAPVGPGPAPGSAEAKLREALLSVAPRAREKDLFVRLGLDESAGREDAKKAFLAIARQFHPDRFASPAFAELQDTVRDFFAAVNEAYEVLADDAKRAAYLAGRKGKAAAHAEAARVDYLKAEACLRTRDFARARGFLESAVRAHAKAEYQAALAHAYIADPARPDRERAKVLLAEATKDPACDRAFFVAGLLARDEGDDAAAEKNLRAALRANPRNADAVRELRHLESRRADKRR